MTFRRRKFQKRYFSLFFLLLLVFFSSTWAYQNNKLYRIPEKALYCGTGVILASTARLVKLGWKVILITPWSSTFGNECLFFSHLLDCTAQVVFSRGFAGKTYAPLHSWQKNKTLLAQIPTHSDQELQLLKFLKRRWLSKSNGYYPTIIEKVCPFFDISVQVHPETTNSYARDPCSKTSRTYEKRVNHWKQSLPHPEEFPLILTRHYKLQEYLPSCIEVPLYEEVQETIKRSALEIQRTKTKVLIDLTNAFPNDFTQEKWLENWEKYRLELFETCKKQNLDPQQLLCIQRVQHNDFGGIRLLSLDLSEINADHHFLLEWISTFGLTANLVELDRLHLATDQSTLKSNPSISHLKKKDPFLAYLNTFTSNWKSSSPQKTFMVKGVIQVLKGLFSELSEERWNKIQYNPTRSAIAKLSMKRIKEQLKYLESKAEEVSFYDTIAHLEEIHENTSILLEIFSPFTYEDFPLIYKDALSSIPKKLLPLTSCAIHSAAMTCLTGIFKAAEKTLNRTPRVLYGENTYFECIDATEKITHATSIKEATEEDWKSVDLILTQFNPVLKRASITEYKTEKIAKYLHKSLEIERENPLVLVIDCTLDFLDSPRVKQLLEEFQDAIISGALNIICYRSGLKFDLFGMDNFCGAPLFMMHNQDPTWDSFHFLCSDPVLQTDRLSLNWFCLAYKNAAPQLELYRKQIFDNTRSLLNKIPSRLFSKEVTYRIVPFEKKADPCFIDIKISGSFHQVRAAALVSGCLYIKCMMEKHPVFYRRSLGFSHPNFSVIFGKESTTIRLTLGLDPSQIDIFANCFAIIDTFNGSSWQTLQEKLINSFLVTQ